MVNGRVVSRLKLSSVLSSWFYLLLASQSNFESLGESFYLGNEKFSLTINAQRLENEKRESI